jgi:hypothetical protein
MKPLILLFFSLLFSIATQAQTSGEVDKSPMDMAYFPHNFAHDRKEGQKALIRVIYSRPSMNGRAIFGKLVPYGQVWRTGANEASEIKFYRDVVLSGKKVKAGTYALFTIPNEKEWTIILNTDLDYWGAYSYQAKNDVLRVPAKASPVDQKAENFTIHFEGTGESKGVMKLTWEQTQAEVPFSF